MSDTTEAARSASAATVPVRGAGVIAASERDPYRSERLPREGSTCPECRAVYSKGRWQWLAPPARSYPETCPACRRIADQLCAGVVTVEGPFFREHRSEVAVLIDQCADRCEAADPLERVMDIADIGGGGLRIATTGIRVARAIGEALEHAYQGVLELDFEPGEYLVTVRWRR